MLNLDSSMILWITKKQEYIALNMSNNLVSKNFNRSLKELKSTMTISLLSLHIKYIKVQYHFSHKLVDKGEI